LPNSTPENCQNSAVVDGNQNLKAQEHAKKFNKQKLPKIQRQLMEIKT
jgi:hypothetical protein